MHSPMEIYRYIHSTISMIRWLLIRFDDHSIRHSIRWFYHSYHHSDTVCWCILSWYHLTWWFIRWFHSTISPIHLVIHSTTIHFMEGCSWFPRCIPFYHSIHSWFHRWCILQITFIGRRPTPFSDSIHSTIHSFWFILHSIHSFDIR